MPTGRTPPECDGMWRSLASYDATLCRTASSVGSNVTPRRARVSSAARILRVMGRPDGGHLRGGGLEVAVPHQGVPVLDGKHLTRQTGRVHHAILAGSRLLHHARRLDPRVPPHRHAGPMGSLGQQADRHRIELSVKLEPHGPGFPGLGDDGLGVVAGVELERAPPQLLHRDRGRLPVDGAAGGVGSVVPVEEEAAAGDELHRVDPRRRLEGADPSQESGRIGAHVAHGGDALGEEIAQIPAQLLARAPAGEEQQMDVAVDQARDQVLTLRLEDSGVLRDWAFSRGARAEDPISSHQRDRVGHRRAAGAVPQGGPDDCDGSWKRLGLGRANGRAPTGCRQQAERREDRRGGERRGHEGPSSCCRAPAVHVGGWRNARLCERCHCPEGGAVIRGRIAAVTPATRELRSGGAIKCFRTLEILRESAGLPAGSHEDAGEIRRHRHRRRAGRHLLRRGNGHAGFPSRPFAWLQWVPALPSLPS